MTYNYGQSLIGESLSRYQSKLTIIGCKECPYMLPADVWQNNPCKWPDVQWGDVYSYLVDSPGVFTRESMKAFKSLEAHNYFISGWVQTVYHYQPEKSGSILLKADVKPSQRVNDSPHHPWVAVSKSGSVVTGHCDCMAGLSEACSHVAALLFKLEAAVRLGYTTRACTEEPCKWNNDFVKKVNPDPISRIKFYKTDRVAKAKLRTSRKVKKFSVSTLDQQQQLLQLLKSCSTNPVVLSTFHGYSENFHSTKQTITSTKIPAPLTKFYSESNNKLSVDELHQKCQTISDNLVIQPAVRTFIYDCTRTQSNCITWYEQRAGRITSSTVHSVLHTSLDAPSTSLLLKICNSSPTPLNTPAVIWGREHEATALKHFEQLMSTVHKDFSVQKTGFLIDQNYPFVGASADGIAKCSCHEPFVLEVKCPFKHRFSTLKEFLSTPDCCLSGSHGTQLKANHSYFSQVQLQMYVHDCKLCNFIVWTEKFMIVCNVTRDNAFIKDLLKNAQAFFINAILPELLTRQLQSLKDSKKDNNTKTPLYCVCQKPESGNMIGCDNHACKYKWFHLECINRRQVPKGVWYCSTCKKNQKS